MEAHHIDTAPRDGSKVMICWRQEWFFARWSVDAEFGLGELTRPGWQIFDCDDAWYSLACEPDEPTHWMPAPPLPGQFIQGGGQSRT